MELHQRDKKRIRADAIRMGVKKARQGCIPCMRDYFALARQHGATQEELLAAVEQAEQRGAKTLPRRDLIKIVAASSIAIAAGGLVLSTADHLQAKTQAQAIAAWWGTDSNTQTCCGVPQNFYVGRMGYGAQPQGDAYFFNLNAARGAGHDRTFGYWGVVGPNSRGRYAPTDWGKKQADNAWNAWNHGPNAPFIGGQTIFGDVEPGFGGWSNGSLNNNRAVLNGFLAELFKITPPNTYPGLYTTPLHWSNLFGQTFRPSTNFVLWVSGNDTCGGDLCSPCNFSCNTQQKVAQRLHSSIAQLKVGGHRPVLWQYWISNCGCGDYNVMVQNAVSLAPSIAGNVIPDG